MAYTTFSFSSGQVLTSSAMNALQDNFEALTEQQSGTPRFKGVARAWFSHDGAGTLVGSQYNITSTSRLALGKYQTNFSVVFSGTYGVSCGFFAGGGQGDNRARNVTLYTQASTYVQYKGRNSSTQQDGDEDLPVSLTIWQD